MAIRPKRYSVFSSRPSKVRVMRGFYRIESGASRGCRDILARRERGNLVRDGNTQETETWGGCQVGKQTEEILRVRFAAIANAQERGPVRVDATAIFWLAAKFVRDGNAQETKARGSCQIGKKPKRYSVFNLRPSKVQLPRCFDRRQSG